MSTEVVSYEDDVAIGSDQQSNQQIESGKEDKKEHDMLTLAEKLTAMRKRRQSLHRDHEDTLSALQAELAELKTDWEEQIIHRLLRINKSLSEMKEGDEVLLRPRDSETEDPRVWEVRTVGQVEFGYDKKGNMSALVKLHGLRAIEQIRQMHADTDFDSVTLLPVALTANDLGKMKTFLSAMYGDVEPIMIRYPEWKKKSK